MANTVPQAISLYTLISCLSIWSAWRSGSHFDTRASASEAGVYLPYDEDRSGVVKSAPGGSDAQVYV